MLVGLCYDRHPMAGYSMRPEDCEFLILVPSMPHTVELGLNKCLPNVRMITSFSSERPLQMYFFQLSLFLFYFSWF